VNLISHPVNLGAGAAIQTGLKYAAENHHQMAVIIDGDGQHNPEEVPKLVASMQESRADVVIGSRFLKKGRGRIHWARRAGIFLFSKIVLVLCRQKITDTTSGYRLYNARAIHHLAREIPLDFPDADMLISLILSGFKVIEVPVTTNERVAGQSMYSFLRSTYYPFKVLISIIAVLTRKIFAGRKK
ncbi:glycosyltransferase family 2 protein, partial [Candidatus Margulisiibacteriota bacterium]